MSDWLGKMSFLPPAVESFQTILYSDASGAVAPGAAAVVTSFRGAAIGDLNQP